MTLQHIIFEVTSDCNLNCAYCYNHWKRDASFECLNSYRKALNVLKRLVTTTDIAHITFTGGEPFVSERFTELVLYCRMKGRNVSVITNGNAGKVSDYRDLISLGVNVFQLPFLSSYPETHDGLTNVKGSWDKVITSITDIIRLGGYIVPVIVLTRKNYKDIQQTLAFLNDLGLRRIMLNRYNIGGKGTKEDTLSLSKTEINHAFEIANRYAETMGLAITSNVCSPHCYINPALYPNIGFGNCSPDVTFRPITVNINGDIRLCNHSPVVAGNIFKESLPQILSSDYPQQWTAVVPTFCAKCELYAKCMGGCRAASEQMGLSLNYADPIVDHL